MNSVWEYVSVFIEVGTVGFLLLLLLIWKIFKFVVFLLFWLFVFNWGLRLLSWVFYLDFLLRSFECDWLKDGTGFIWNLFFLTTKSWEVLVVEGVYLILNASKIFKKIHSIDRYWNTCIHQVGDIIVKLNKIGIYHWERWLHFFFLIYYIWKWF